MDARTRLICWRETPTPRNRSSSLPLPHPAHHHAPGCVVGVLGAGGVAKAAGIGGGQGLAGDVAAVAAHGGVVCFYAGGQHVVVHALGEFGGGAGDAVAGIQPLGLDGLAVDVPVAVDGKAVQRHADEVRWAAG